MNLAKYEALAAAVEQGSLTLAAKQLEITQSAVSHAIDSLEKELGFPLLKRSRGGVHLTEEGEQLMPLVEQQISTVTPDYAVLTANKKQGLYSFQENRMLIPCSFDKVIANTTSLDPYVLHGYVSVENAGTRYYVDTADGTATESCCLIRKKSMWMIPNS